VRKSRGESEYYKARSDKALEIIDQLKIEVDVLRGRVREGMKSGRFERIEIATIQFTLHSS